MPQHMEPVAASEPALWHSTIHVLTDRGLTIEDLRRPFGLIQTAPVPVDTTRSAAWASCADPLQNAIPRPDRVALTIRLKAEGDHKSKLHIAPTWSYHADAEVRCTTNDVWERDLLAEIQAAAVVADSARG